MKPPEQEQPKGESLIIAEERKSEFSNYQAENRQRKVRRGEEIAGIKY